MSLLSGAKKSATVKPLIVTLFGDAGSGKTSLACEFPDAFLIQTRGESVPRGVTHQPDQLDPIGDKRTGGEVSIWDENELFDQLVALVREEHDYKTLIIDSVTGLEDLFVKNILDVQPPKQKTMNAAGTGYGSAWDRVVAKHSSVMRAAEALRGKRGMNVVFLGHCSITRLEPPDTEPYTKYVLGLNTSDKPSKDCAGIYTRNVDVVGFVHQKMFTIGEGDVKKAKTSGERLIGVDLTPANVSKNRLGITGSLKYVQGENPFEEFML